MQLEVLVEEESAKRALKPLLSALFDGRRVKISVRTFCGKPDLLKKLPERLAGYAASRRRGEDIRVVVLVDRDNDTCTELKTRMDEIARSAGLVPRGDDSGTGRFQVVNRIAVRELESWYFGDWPAVRKAFPKMGAEPPKKYRGNPDAAQGKCSDAFEKALSASGVRMASKPQWAERVGAHLSLTENASPSFHAFVRGVGDLVGE
ncbi:MULTISPECIES: DUF4276 family protein [Streptomyces]|uniref:DUF4276 family protein n=1 Tax=Streptomyces TaxID=1883 RepID=UPI00130061CD|nr:MULTISPECIES: DUF4276 family protein [Streptomyces]